jgi:hypothetical protein
VGNTFRRYNNGICYSELLCDVENTGNGGYPSFGGSSQGAIVRTWYVVLRERILGLDCVTACDILTTRHMAKNSLNSISFELAQGKRMAVRSGRTRHTRSRLSKIYISRL